MDNLIKRLSVTLILAVVISSCLVMMPTNSQLSDWSTIYTGNNGQGNCVIATQDEGYVFTGESNGQYFLAEANSNGNIVWWKTYDSGEANSVIQTSDGGFAMGGSGSVNFIKTDSSGNIQWKKDFMNGERTFEVNSLAQSSDGSYVLAGYTPAGGSPLFDWTIKIDQAGNILWTKTYGTVPNRSDATNILAVNNGYILAANENLYSLEQNGNVQWTSQNLEGLTTGLTSTSDAGYLACTNSGFLTKVDSEGNVQWSKYDYWIDGVAPIFSSVIEAEGGIFVVAGESYSGYYGVGCIIETDSVGNSLSVMTEPIFTGHNGYIDSITKATNGGYVITGNIQSINDPDYSPVWLAKVSTSILQPSSVLVSALLGTSPTPPPSLIPSPTSNPSPTPTPTPIQTPSPTPAVPELSWLAVLPLLLSIFSVVVLRHRKTK